MSIEYFCDACGEEVKGPDKRICLLINGVRYMPDLCEKCMQLIINLAYKSSGEFYHDDKK